jgi:hypothetical protein
MQIAEAATSKMSDGTEACRIDGFHMKSSILIPGLIGSTIIVRPGRLAARSTSEAAGMHHPFLHD